MLPEPRHLNLSLVSLLPRPARNNRWIPTDLILKRLLCHLVLSSKKSLSIWACLKVVSLVRTSPPLTKLKYNLKIVNSLNRSVAAVQRINRQIKWKTQLLVVAWTFKNISMVATADQTYPTDHLLKTNPFINSNNYSSRIMYLIIAAWVQMFS